MAKKQVDLDFSLENGITTIGNLSDLSTPYEQTKIIKDILLKNLTPGGWAYNEGYGMCVCILFLGFAVGMNVPLNIYYFPLGFIGFACAIIFLTLIFYPTHYFKIRAKQRAHRVALKVDKATDSKIRVSFTYHTSKNGTIDITGHIKLIHVQIL